jgi:hypothetical protein
MADEKPSRSAPSQIPDLQASLADAWEVIGVLEEKVNDLVLEVSAALIALAKTVPGFAEEYERAHSAALASQRKSDSELPLSVQRAIRQLRQSGKGKHS